MSKSADSARELSRSALGMLVAALLVAPIGHAQTFWNNPAGGSANVAGNWSNGVPTGGMPAQFNLPGSYSVSLTAPLQTGNVDFNVGEVTLDLGGQTWQAGNVNIGPLTTSAPQAAALVVRDGRLASPSTITVGRLSGIGSLTVRDAASVEAGTFRAENSSVTSVTGPGSYLGFSLLSVGTSGAPAPSELHVSGGGTVVGGFSSAGTTASNAFGTVRVRDVGSRIRNVFGWNVVVENGAVAEYTSANNLAGEVLIDHSTLSIGGDFNVGPSTSGLLAGRLILRASTLTSTSNSNTLRVLGGSSMELENAVLSTGRQLINDGIVRGSGRSLGTLLNGTTGSLTVGAGERLAFDGRSTVNANYGLINIDGGELTFAHAVTNQSSGAIVARNATLRVGDGTGQYTLVQSNLSSTSFVGGSNSVFGDVNLQVGSRIVHTGGSQTLYFDDIANNGTIQTSAGSMATFLGSVTGSGSFSGSGTTTFEGDLRPGNSPALVRFGGDVRIGESATLTIEIGGPIRGSDYDAIDVAGKLTLDGTVVITRLDGYVPLPGQVFDFFHYGSIDGTPGIVNQTGLPGLAFDANIAGNGWQVAITGTPGDADLNGMVDFNDLLTLARHYNQATGQNWLTGDFDASGSVDFNDLLAMARNYGKSLGAPPTSVAFDEDWALAQAIVPEPTSIGILALTGHCLIRRRLPRN